MEHRQPANSFSTFGNGQNHNQNYISEQPFTATGRFAALGGGSFVHPGPGDVLASSEDQHWNSRGRVHQYHYSSSSMEAAHFPPQISGPPYVPFPQSSVAGNLCIPGSNGLHSRHHDRLTDEFDGNLADHPQCIQSGRFKRKRSCISGHCERGSSSRFYDVGSSSRSPGMLRPIQENENIPSNHTGFPHRSSSISINADESWRNVRSRYRCDSGHDADRSHMPNYPSIQYQSTTHPTNYSGISNTRSITVGSSTGDLNSVTYGRNSHPDSGGSTLETNPSYFGGGAADISAHHVGGFSSGNFNSSSHYVPGFAQDARESHTSYSGRILPPNGNNLSHPQLGYAAASTENGMHSSAEMFSFRHMRALAVEGRRNRPQHGRFGVTDERFRSLSSLADAHDRMRPEPYMFEQQSFSDGPRSLLDEYVGMRLDVDSMSYEELLALGERIGSVNTGLSEDMISKCIKAEAFGSSNSKEKRCAICLEVYEKKDEIGSLIKCGHDYHVSCISKWLSMKNACPICKSAALIMADDNN
nr:probable E3 ubiquitin-protein ligase HIP1 isoform X1 [Ipomoea trifida]